MKGWRYPCGLIGALALPGAAFAQAESTTFTYDALGRLIEARSVASGDTITNDYSYDDAHNRVSDTVTDTGSLAPPPEAPPSDPPVEPEE